MKNTDKIRQMPADELAKRIKYPCPSCTYLIGDCLTKDCLEGIINWLESEAE